MSNSKFNFSKASSSFRGFLDKAMKKADKLTENLGNTDRKFDFDESYFTFELQGGPKHTDLLKATATICEGEKAGTTVHMICKWFKCDASSEMKEISGVTGACYQPSIDDVGSKILVQGTPAIIFGNYTGMPVFKEMGPLIMDHDVERDALDHLEKDILELQGRIESIELKETEPTFSTPMPILFQFNKHSNALTIIALHEGGSKEELFTIDASDIYPIVELDQMYKNLIHIRFNEKDQAKITVDNHVDRDVLAICLRMFGKGLLDDGSDLIKEMSDKIKKQEEEEEELRKKEEEEAAKRKQEEEEKREAGEEIDEQEETTGVQKKGHTEIDPDALQPQSQEEDEEEEQKMAEQQSVEAEVQSPDKVSQQQQKQNRNKGNLDSLMKLQQVQKENKLLKTELDQLKSDLKIKEDHNKQMSQEIEEVSMKLKAIQDDYLATKENAEKAFTDYERMSNEKTFYLQEINLYKAQIEDLEGRLSQKEQVEQQSQMLTVEKKDIKMQYDDELNKQKTIIQQLEVEVDQLRSDKARMVRELDLNSTEKENMQSQINSLKNKIKSLVSENEKLAHSPHHANSFSKGSPGQTRSQSQTSEHEDKGFSLQINELNDPVGNLEREVRSLKLQNERLNLTLETYKVSMESKSPKKSGGSFFDKLGITAKTVNPQQFDYLQKLVNTLTETITEKEAQVDNHKTINKALANRITELERKIQALEKLRNSEEQQSTNESSQQGNGNLKDNTSVSKSNNDSQ